MTILDQFRDGGRSPASARVADVLAAARPPVAGLAPATRVAAWTLAAATAAASTAEFLLTPMAASAVGVEEGPVALAADLLLWPVPWLQPSLLAAIAILVVAIAASTRGFEAMTAGHSGTLIAAAMVGAVALIPGVLILAGVLVAVTVGAAIVVGLFWLLISIVAEG